MAQYSKVYIINTLQRNGLTTFLYKLGVANSKMLGYANAYNYMSTQETTGHTRAEAIKLTAHKFKINRRSVYNVIAEMEMVIEVTTDVEKLLSIKA